MSRPTGKLFGWALALLVIALFCSLGLWQLDRAKQKEAMLAESRKVLGELKPMPLSAASDPARTAAYDWVEGEGVFLEGPAVLLDNQTRNGSPGIRAYRAFQPASGGAALLVELGWLPMPGDRHLPKVEQPRGPVRVAGLLASPPSAGIAAAGAAPQADGTLLAIGLDPVVLSRALNLPTLAPRVLRLDPALKLGYARDLDILPNTLPPERHLGYAVQWFGLALAVLITVSVLTLRRRRRR
ncbi:MAG TPA: SURF1 family protein [Pseudoxanthomonas sp.]